MILPCLKRFEFIYDNNQINEYGHYLKGINIYDSNNASLGNWAFDYNDKLPVTPNVENKSQDKWGFYNGKPNKTLLEDPSNMMIFKIKKYITVKNDEYDSGRSIKYSRPEATEFYGLNNGMLGSNFGLYVYSIPFANRDFVFSQAIKGDTEKREDTNRGNV